MKPSNKKPVWIGLGIVVVVAIIAGVVIASRHTDSMSGMNMKTGSAPAAADAVATNSVQIKSYAFAPAAIKVKVGATVTWTNEDDVQHTVTADSGTGPKSDLLSRGQSYTFTFDKAGTYTYHCMPHPYMHGTVVVTN